MPGTTVVRSFKSKDLASLVHIPFSTSNVLDLVRRQYPALLGIDPQNLEQARVQLTTQFRNVAAPGTSLDAVFAAITKRLEEVHQNVEALTTRGGFGSTVHPTDTLRALYKPVSPYGDEEWKLAIALYYHAGLERKPAEVTTASEIQLKEIEFHRNLAVSSAYPILMRLLGLIIDFEIPMASAGGLPSSGVVMLKPLWKPSAAVDALPDVLPQTRYLLESRKRFEAAPRSQNSHLHHGLINLNHRDAGVPCYHLEQIDALPEVLKLLSYIRATLADPTAREVLPTPRTGGIAIVGDCVIENLIENLHSSQAVERKIGPAPPPIEFSAEDLVRGYRMDVKPQTSGQWLSLCLRLGEYHFTTLDAKAKLEDEGWLSKSAARVGPTLSITPAGSDLLAIHDTLSKWEGWSHCAPRPGVGIKSKSLTNVGSFESAPFKVRFTPLEKSLPRLRFGESYSVRVRTADLAGNGIDLQETSEDRETALESFPYYRFDPVPAPDVIPRKLMVEPGESVFQLVIRSNFDTQSQQTTERHLAPPRGSELLAEMHRKFDKDSGLDKGAYDTIEDHEGEAPEIYPKEHYTPPYLPDPLASGVTFHGFRSEGDDPYRLTFVPNAKKWLRLKPWRLKIVEHPDTKLGLSEDPPVYHPVEANEHNGVLTVFLPKAASLTIGVNSTLLEENLGLMGFWHMILTSFPRSSDLFKNHILNECHWMFTPCRELKLVHAVRQPLFKPRFKGDSEQNPLPDDDARISVERSPNETFATLGATMIMPGRSANKISVDGAWAEFIDDGKPETLFVIKQAGSQAFDFPLEPVDGEVEFKKKHEFADTKHRLVKYKVTAATRFREYFKDSEIESGITQHSREVARHIPNSALPPTPELLYCIPTFGWERRQVEEKKVSRRRRGGGLRLYLNRPWYRTGANELVGIVIAEDPAQASNAQLSRWGRDPISSVRGPEVLREEDFAGQIEHRGSYSWGNPQLRVKVLGYPVKFDEVRKLWVCDLVINSRDAYFPFVRLMLTRYQPYSLPHLHLSPGVLSGFAQVAPDRTASIVLDTAGPGHVLKVRLDGRAVVKENKVIVAVEVGQKPFADHINWEPAFKEPYQLEFRNDSSGPHWGIDEISLPFGSGPLRVTFFEYEEYDIDAASGPLPGGTGERLVYSGVLEL